MIIYKDQKGRADQYLSSLCYNTLLLSKVQTYDDLFKTDKKKNKNVMTIKGYNLITLLFFFGFAVILFFLCFSFS